MVRFSQPLISLSFKTSCPQFPFLPHSVPELISISAVASLAEKQKALEAYALTAKPEQFLSSTPLSGSEKQKLLEQYVKSNQGKQELEREIKKQKKAARQPILWQIPEEKMKELQWKRTQLLRLQAEQAKKKNGAAIAGKGAKVVQGPVKKVQPKGLANGKPVKPVRLPSSGSKVSI